MSAFCPEGTSGSTTAKAVPHYHFEIMIKIGRELAVELTIRLLQPPQIA
jgi:hypothetical protein